MPSRRAVPPRLRVPGYVVEDFLGRGAYGDVWRGRVRRTGAAVALKRIPISDAAQRAAALKEAAVLSALDHPHLVRLHSTVRLPDAVVLVLDLAAAGALGSVVAARGRLTPGEVVTAVAPVAAALAYAHRAGVVHGDVSPANIFFAANGMPLLGDLGVARLLGSDAPVRTTPAYVDPVLNAGELPGPSTDVFMIGGVALFALTGAPPWRGATAAEVLAAAAAPEQFDPAGRLRAAGVPDEVARVVVRALSIDPGERGTAAEFALELRASTRAVAVEFDAGRVDPVRPGGRHAAPVRSHGNAEPFTDGVRLPSPLEGARRRRLHRPAAVAAVAIAAVATAACLHLLAPGRSDRHAAAPATPVSRATSHAPPPVSPRTQTLQPMPRTALPAPRTRTAQPARRTRTIPLVRTPASRSANAEVDVSTVRRLLASLDAARAAAFALREPARLGGVYASPALLARDRALLLAIVPPGCGLVGVRTSYRDVRLAHASGPTVSVLGRASVTASRLVCGATPVGQAPGTPQGTVRIDLVRQGNGYRISSLRVGSRPATPKAAGSQAATG